MIIRMNGNELNVQSMLQKALESLKFLIRVEYYNGQKFEGSIKSFKYNHPKTNLPPMTELSLWTEDNFIDLEINQIKNIEGIG